MEDKESGFTLVETLITLVILSFLIFLPLLSIDQAIHSVKADLFFRELSSNITMMQNHAILNGENTVVKFVPRDHTIQFEVYTKDYQTTHPLNREMTLKGEDYEFFGKKYLSFYFAANTGSITVTDHHWRVRFKMKEELYELVFKLGSGRFEIKKR